MLALDIAGASATATLAGLGLRQWRLRRKTIKHLDVEAELERKELTIETSNQLIGALKERIEQLERQVNELQTAVVESTAIIKELRLRLDSAQAYAAPEAVARFEGELSAQTTILKRIEVALSSPLTVKPE